MCVHILTAVETLAQEKRRLVQLPVWEESRRTSEKCEAEGSAELSLKSVPRPPAPPPANQHTEWR